MFICTIIVVITNVRKTVYMQECKNYSIAMLPLCLHNLQVHLHSVCANVYYCLKSKCFMRIKFPSRTLDSFVSLRKR